MFPTQTSRLTTGNDRKVPVPHALRIVKTFGRANQRSLAAIVAEELRELFAHALERMKELTPEPADPPSLITVARLVGRG